MRKYISATGLKMLILLVVFLQLVIWWIILRTNENVTDNALEVFSGSYGVVALLGGIFGLGVSRHWGGAKSMVGRAIMLFSLGLLAQEFGQISYSFYTFAFHVDIPYPSVGDIGYMGSVFLYIAGAFTLLKVLVRKLSIKTYAGKLQAVLIPLAVLIFSYIEFLRQYEVDWSAPVAVILDFAYPLGQAIYISLAILAFLLSRKYLGGRMRPVMLLLILALGVQYAADFMFLYQTNNETWTTAGPNDLIYLISYFVMSLALLKFNSVLDKPSDEESTEVSQ